MKFRRPSQDPNKLYYYCRLTTAIENILPSNKLLLSPLVKTNDPRENKNLLFSYNCSRKLPASLEYLNDQYSKFLRKDCKVLCFSKDYKGYQGCHLSKMWAHYGQNHEGVCLQINRDKFLTENKKIIKIEQFKEIEYLEYDSKQHQIQPTINFDHINQHGDFFYMKEVFRKENLDFLFFTKSQEWESESEVRLLYFSDLQSNEYCSIKESLECIHLGVDFNAAYLPSIRSLANGRELFQMHFLPNGLISKILS